MQGLGLGFWRAGLGEMPVNIHCNVEDARNREAVGGGVFVDDEVM